MDPVDVIAVVGPCTPERLRYAQRLAMRTNRMFIPATRLAAACDPAREVAALAPWADTPAGMVAELPGDTSATDLIGALAEEGEATRLVGLVCVVDAAHLLDDLHRDDYAARGRAGIGQTARALLTAMQLEYASTIILMGWDPLTPAELATIMALVSHLSPFARLRLHRRTMEQIEATEPYPAGQSRPGWISLLNGDFDPHMTDARVGAFRYEQVRPLHPKRLMAVLDRIETGEFGVLVRSAGFCRLATRPHVIAQWEHVGQMLSLTPLGGDDRLAEDEELLAIGQDLALIGLRLEPDRLAAALDDAALTDAELAAGPMAWAGFADPFPIWQTAPGRAD